METPLFLSGSDTWAPLGLAYYDGKLFVAGLRGEELRMFDLEKGTSKPLFKNGGRLRDLLVDNNHLYILTNNTDGRGNPDQDDDHLLRLTLSRLDL